MQSLVTKQSTTERHESATQQISVSEWSSAGTVVYAPASAAVSVTTAAHIPAAPVSAAATPEIRTASIYAYFGSGVGYRLVRVAIQERPDATVLAMVLPCGKTARIWNYGKRGVGVQVQSKSHPSVWYTVTAARCQCTRFHHQHQCSHQVAAQEALAVWERYSGYMAQKAVA